MSLIAISLALAWFGILFIGFAVDGLLKRIEELEKSVGAKK